MSERNTPDRGDQQEQEGVLEQAGEGKEPLSGEYIKHQRQGPADTGEAIPADTSRRSRIGMLVLLVTFVGFGGWAVVAQIDGAVIAPGQVIVDSRNRVVQHLEGGIVSEILVEDGDQVERGEVLMRLSGAQTRSELRTTESQLWEALGREARLLAERAGAEEVEFPQQLLERQEKAEIQSIVDGQRELFEARRESLQGQLEIYDTRIESQQAQLGGYRSLIGNLEGRIGNYEEEIADWRELFERELSDRLRINEMEREKLALEGEKISSTAQASEIEIGIGETRTESLVTRQDFIEQVASSLRDTQERIAELSSRRVALRDQMERLAIRAPETGHIVGKQVSTEGAVIGAGDTIMEVVPSDQRYTITARVEPADIDRISLGHKADIRLSAFNYQVAHRLEGEVTRISADALEEEGRDGERYYEARVQLTERGMRRMREQDMYMVPGMPAEVMINTGQRTFMQYLLEPFSRLFERAFREE